MSIFELCIMLIHCDLARLYFLHKTCWVDSTLGSPDWTVRLNACTVHVVPARIMQLLWCWQFSLLFCLYSDNQKTLEYEDDFIAVLKCIWSCHKANSFRHLLNHKLSKMGLFTLHHSCISCLLDYLKFKLDSKSRLPITEFSGYHCTGFVKMHLMYFCQHWKLWISNLDNCL